MGIISGFVKGLGQGTAQAGQMMLQDKMNKERDEANYLRDAQLRTKLQSEDHDFRSGMETDRLKNQRDLQGGRIDADKAAAEVKVGTDQEAAEALGEINKEVARIRSATTVNKLSDKEKAAAALIAKGYAPDIANGVAFGAIKEIKDADTGDMFLVNALTSKKIGTMTTVNGKPTYIPEGGQSENAEVTSAHRTLATKRMNKKAKYLNSDDTDFPETDGDRKSWKRQEAQKIANEERDAKNADKEEPAIVEEPPAQDAGIVASEAEAETKQFGMQSYTFEEFSAAMKKTHGAKATPQALKETWDSIGKK
jgi:hypothetical protein